MIFNFNALQGCIRRIACAGTVVLVLPMFVSADIGDFTVIVQPGESNEIDCKKFSIRLDIEGYGGIPLDQGVCAGWFDYTFDSTIEERETYYRNFQAYQYQSGDARYGVNTETFKVMVVGDKVWVEWKTVPQGSGLHTEHEYRVYQKGYRSPLISRNVKYLAKGGWSSMVSDQLTVVRFSKSYIELQIDCIFEGFSYAKQALYRWDEDRDMFVANVKLKANVVYGFNQQNSVDIISARIAYKPKPEDIMSDIYSYFHVSDTALVPLDDGTLEFKLDQKRQEELFAPVRDDIARSLHELLGAGSR